MKSTKKDMKQEDMEEFEDIHIEEDQKNDADKTAEKKDKKKNKRS